MAHSNVLNTHWHALLLERQQCSALVLQKEDCRCRRRPVSQTPVSHTLRWHAYKLCQARLETDKHARETDNQIGVHSENDPPIKLTVNARQREERYTT